MFRSKSLLFCSNAGCLKHNEEIYHHVQQLLQSKGKSGEIKLAWSLCMRSCAVGPNILVLPEGDIHSHMTIEKAEEIVNDLLKN
ncbi:MAG: (2Fe-2S) ferredoxin domain-containing protein [Clostridiales bacterium]|nr:(2Fe-2S) ferredoxin domain-containing protein [Clostridiales bacterium]